MSQVLSLLDAALTARQSFVDDGHTSAFRLFNGFVEGLPALCVDIYARTALIHNYAASPEDDHSAYTGNWIQDNLPWVNCIIVKTRNSPAPLQKRGQIIHGSTPATKIIENNIWYALNLTMNRDASFYMDTRDLRAWITANLSGKTVLNTFAYTGSLGVAALAGSAEQVIQLDRSRLFLDIARQSYRLNDFPIKKEDFLEQDFFPAIGQLKHSGKMFDCILLDPPFFSSSSKGKVDLVADGSRLINKVRPLINDNGCLVSINNALFVSGKDYLASLQDLCKDGYLKIEELISIPADFTGYAQTRAGSQPVDPQPFNHSTKIAILRVRRKSGGIKSQPQL